jgi:hypothetical protein
LLADPGAKRETAVRSRLGIYKPNLEREKIPGVAHLGAKRKTAALRTGEKYENSVIKQNLETENTPRVADLGVNCS